MLASYSFRCFLGQIDEIRAYFSHGRSWFQAFSLRAGLSLGKRCLGEPPRELPPGPSRRMPRAAE